jgi:hypothetical protein
MHLWVVGSICTYLFVGLLLGIRAIRKTLDEIRILEQETETKTGNHEATFVLPIIYEFLGLLLLWPFMLDVFLSKNRW